ncbi:MAG: hypothetical protein ACRC2B_23105 [Rubrivivax sp.]
MNRPTAQTVGFFFGLVALGGVATAGAIRARRASILTGAGLAGKNHQEALGQSRKIAR